MYPDFLTCGLCADEFPLSQIMDFIMHKTTCLQAGGSGQAGLSVLSQQTLSCYLCQQDFHTARGFLHHLQLSHHMEVVQQKTPIAVFPQVYVDPSQPVTSAIPDNPCAADNRPAPRVATANSISDTHTSDVSHTADEVCVSSVTEAAMPVTCAKLASAAGTTICCNGKECQVTINPPQQSPPSPKKCCSSVVPKKRTRHMQEHDSEDMEQCALETLCSLRGRLPMNQKCRPGHRKAKKSSKSSRNRKSQCIMSCERELICVTKASEESEPEAKEEERCQVCEEDSECLGTDSSCSSDPKKSRVEIYSVEKDSITSRKTVIMNSGMTVTVQPTESSSPKKNHSSQVPPASQASPVPSEDTSQESARILAELMYHSVQPVDQSQIVPLQTLPASDSQAPDGGFQSSLSDPAESDLLPLVPGLSSADAGNFSGSLCPMFMNPSVSTPMETGMNVPGHAVPSQGGVEQSLDMHQLQDLEALTAAIQRCPGLDRLSQQGEGLSVPDPAPVSMDSSINTFSPSEGSAHDGDGKVVVVGKSLKKRRYPTSRPYKCSECDQAFNQPIHLKKHMSKHTGVKPFKCENCDYSTVERSHLKAHNRIHTGEKPFQCNFCSYATAQNSTLKVHLRRHHLDRQTADGGATSSKTR